jgi:hypothetical protein
MRQERTNELWSFTTAKTATEAGTRDLPLKWEVFVTPGVPTVASDPSKLDELVARVSKKAH